MGCGSSIPVAAGEDARMNGVDVKKANNTTTTNTTAGSGGGGSSYTTKVSLSESMMNDKNTTGTTTEGMTKNHPSEITPTTTNPATTSNSNINDGNNSITSSSTPTKNKKQVTNRRVGNTNTNNASPLKRKGLIKMGKGNNNTPNTNDNSSIGNGTTNNNGTTTNNNNLSSIAANIRTRADTWEVMDELHVPIDHNNHDSKNNDNDDDHKKPVLVDDYLDMNDNDIPISKSTTTINPNGEHENIDIGTNNTPQINHGSKPRLSTSASSINDNNEANITTTTGNNTSSVLGPIQEQWRMIWETQSNAIVDPMDVVSVIQHNMNTIINQLSSVQITLLLRKVRNIIKDVLPPSTTTSSSSSNSIINNNSNHTNSNKSKNDQSSTSKIVAKVFASSNNNSNNQQQTALQNESRMILDKYNTLNRSLLLRILPKLSSSSSSSSSVSDITESIIILMLSLDVNTNTSILLERVCVAATQAIESISSFEIDVNHKLFAATTTTTTTTSATSSNTSSNNNAMKKIPKPSQIPVFLDDVPSVDLPIGTSFTSVATIIALALASSRQQQIHLLFYICMKPTILKDFLLLHPAGGIPLWLLEVNQSTVFSLPSLTHYHYYGNAFLPCPIENKNGYNMFVPSKSRTPISVDANHVQNVIRLALQHANKKQIINNDNTTTTTGNTQQQATTSVMSTQDRITPSTRSSFSAPLSSFVRRTASLTDVSTSTLSPTNKDNNNIDSSQHNYTSQHSDPTGLTTTATSKKKAKNLLITKLMNVSDGIEVDTYSSLQTEVQETLQHYEYENRKYLDQYDVSDWTLQEFKLWCDTVLTDLALQIVMHYFFGEGILPSPMIEYELVVSKWSEWEKQFSSTYNAHKTNNNNNDGQSITKILTDSVSALIGSPTSSIQPPNGNHSNVTHRPHLGTVFGGIGGIDGLGGSGQGVMYCIPTKWWNTWMKYVGWSYVGERNINLRESNAIRPSSLDTESLLERDPDNVIRGIMGSYELMRRGLKYGIDYVLVPPNVWDILYELYSGGPSLPRMVKPKESSSSFISLISDASSLSFDRNTAKTNALDELDNVVGNMTTTPRVTRLPNSLFVETHPWILHVHICDPLQPYRRGETGPVSIRVMTTPNQPLWRLLSEIVCRFTFQTYRAFDSDMRGKIRLWKKIESKDTPLPRYGPWNLLCKSRFAILPYITNGTEFIGNCDDLIASWKLYGDDATVESIGLLDQNNLMVEFAVLNRNGELTWPREAAAEAGKVRRIADEDKQFRQTLLGIDDNGNALPTPPVLVGMDVDAMEFSGKWYTVKILEVVHVETVSEEEDGDGIESEVSDTVKRVVKKRVKVSFRDHGGHFDWIDVDSDRLQTPGRFASEANLQSPESPTTGIGNGTNGDGRSKSGPTGRRTNSTTESIVENAKSCSLPGYGACGLSNLGNSCYMNSAIQCMAYLPLLRAYLLGGLYKANGDLNKDNPLGTGGRLLEEFAELLRCMWSAKLAEKSPTRFRTHLGKSNEQFACADQQDAQEFLNYMIDVLHEDSNRVRKKPYVEALEDIWVEQTTLSRVGEESWRRYGSKICPVKRHNPLIVY
jgi:Ubiquitin carboxyl-terminal hydrolase/DUSP domain